MSEGNGKLTDEQLLALTEIEVKDSKYTDEDRKRREDLLDKARTERFMKNPYSFVEISELICGTIKSPEASMGVAVYVGKVKRSELDISLTELTIRIQDVLRGMNIESQMKEKIIQPRGVFNFARKRRK